jgi:O-antigen ligase
MSARRTSGPELICLALLFALLLWAPLPFASTPDELQLPLVAGATTVCAASAICLACAKGRLVLSAAHRVWSIGAVAFMLLVALQLVKMPGLLLHLLSPESARIWESAGGVASRIIGPLSSAHPITIDPRATLLHLFRLLAYFATFTAGALLIRRHAQRVALAVALSCGALFQTVYGLREALLHRFAIWGWKNTLMYDRVTGTFVNPNHFADYTAMAAPFGAFLLAMAWHDAPRSARLWRRIVKMTERRVLPAAFGALVVISCIVAVLVSKSRGALLALFAGAAVGLAAVTGRRIIRVLLFLAAGALVVTAIALYLGNARTSMSRLPTEAEARALGGRRTGLETALSIWRRYPVFGSGLGTFGDIAPMAQPDAFERLYTHAHDDYAEIAATTGAIGVAVFVVALAMGMKRFTQAAFSEGRSWRRRAFHAAALASMATALTHALVDFDFFIPANAVTLAAIAGAAVAATRRESVAVDDSGSEDSQAGSRRDAVQPVPTESSSS